MCASLIEMQAPAVVSAELLYKESRDPDTSWQVGKTMKANLSFSSSLCTIVRGLLQVQIIL